MIEVNQTANGSVSLGTVDKQGLSVIVRAASSLGGGTITIGARQANDDSGVIEALDATLAAGSSATYTIGKGVELWATLSGATTPDIDYLVSEY